MGKLEPIRIAQLSKQVQGHWVAVRDDEIIDAAVTLDELMNQLHVRSISDVTVFRASAPGDVELVGLG
jgi:hypothetical protein